VVGVLLAALYDPVFTTSVRDPRDFALALAAPGRRLRGRWRRAGPGNRLTLDLRAAPTDGCAPNV